MDEFFANLPYEDALDIEQATKAIYALREQRGKLLAGLGVADEAALLARIASGELDEHPAYEQFLSAGILDATREALRRALAGELVQLNGTARARAEDAPGDAPEDAPGDAAGDAAAALIPLQLKPQIEAACKDELAGEVTAMQDALLLKLHNGVEVELRVLSAQHYCFSWLWGEALLRIDTAPGADGRGEGASHFHDVDGQRRPDPLSVPGAAPLANICRLLKALSADPLLGS